MKLLPSCLLVHGKPVAVSGGDVLDHSAGKGQIRTNPGACVSDHSRSGRASGSTPVMTKAGAQECLQELGLPLAVLESLQSCGESRTEPGVGILKLQAHVEGCILTVVELVGKC